MAILFTVSDKSSYSGLSIARTAILPLDKVCFESSASLSIILTSTPFSINLAAKATELSSTPSTAQIIASGFVLIEIFCGLHSFKPTSRLDGTVTASSPYIIVKLNAVVSYIIDDPSLRFLSLSSAKTDSLMSASNSKIAAINGASGCKFGIIILPAGIT